MSAPQPVKVCDVLSIITRGYHARAVCSPNHHPSSLCIYRFLGPFYRPFYAATTATHWQFRNIAITSQRASLHQTHTHKRGGRKCIVHHKFHMFVIQSIMVSSMRTQFSLPSFVHGALRVTYGPRTTKGASQKCECVMYGLLQTRHSPDGTRAHTGYT